MRERVNFIRRTEVDAVDLVDDLSEKEPAVHPVDHASKYVGYYVTLVLTAVHSPELPQVLKQLLALRAVRSNGNENTMVVVVRIGPVVRFVPPRLVPRGSRYLL
jgi:hypothetical protein